MKPSISIITVTFNAAGVLPGLIASLRAQSDRDFEWVIVDGASTDGTVELIKSSGDIVSAWVSEPDCGIYDAMNKAIGMASGEYYVVCGADDRLFANAIADYRQAVSEKPVDIVAACVETDAGIVRPMRGKPWLHGQSAFVSHHSVGTLIRKELHREYGLYSRRFPIAADQYFLKRACMSGRPRIAAADFIAGHYSKGGVSGTDILGTLSDYCRVQLETERFPALQVLLHCIRLLKNFRGIVAYGKSRRADRP